MRRTPRTTSTTNYEGNIRSARGDLATAGHLATY